MKLCAPPERENLFFRGEGTATRRLVGVELTTYPGAQLVEHRVRGLYHNCFAMEMFL